MASGPAAGSMRKRVEALRKELQDHDYRYYVLSQPTISDEEYDRFMRELVELERANPQFVTPDSPSQRVGGEPTKEFPAVTHAVSMLSLLFLNRARRSRGALETIPINLATQARRRGADRSHALAGRE